MASRPIKAAMMWAGAFAMAIVAGAAQADPARSSAGDAFSQQDDFTPQPNQVGPQAPHRTLQWDARKGRWGVNVDVAQPVGRDPDWGDARIGLNYRVAPGLRTGVGVSLGNEQPPDTHQFMPQGPAPRVRLETTFKF